VKPRKVLLEAPALVLARREGIPEKHRVVSCSVCLVFPGRPSGHQGDWTLNPHHPTTVPRPGSTKVILGNQRPRYQCARPQQPPGMQPLFPGGEPQQAVSPGPGSALPFRTPEADEVTESSFLRSSASQPGQRGFSFSPKIKCSETFPHDEHKNSWMGMVSILVSDDCIPRHGHGQRRYVQP